MDLIFNQVVMAASSAASSKASSTGASAGAMILQLLPIPLILVFFYFFLIRPQKKKDKETQSMRSTVQVGDEIMTVGGIVGIVVRKSDDTVVIETGGDKSKLRIKTWAIQENLTLHDNAPSK